MVCQTPSSCITPGSELGAAQGQKLAERQVPPPRAPAPIPASGRRLHSPHRAPVLSAGPLRAYTVPSQYYSRGAIKNVSYCSSFQC